MLHRFAVNPNLTVQNHAAYVAINVESTIVDNKYMFLPEQEVPCMFAV